MVRLTAFALLTILAATPAFAQRPAGSEGSEASRMGLPNQGTAGASNGIGHEGSLDHDAGTASSTVQGMKDQVGNMGGAPSKPAASQAVEGDKTQGGSKPAQ